MSIVLRRSLLAVVLLSVAAVAERPNAMAHPPAQKRARAAAARTLAAEAAGTRAISRVAPARRGDGALVGLPQTGDSLHGDIPDGGCYCFATKDGETPKTSVEEVRDLQKCADECPASCKKKHHALKSSKWGSYFVAAQCENDGTCRCLTDEDVDISAITGVEKTETIQECLSKGAKGCHHDNENLGCKKRSGLPLCVGPGGKGNTSNTTEEGRAGRYQPGVAVFVAGFVAMGA